MEDDPLVEGVTQFQYLSSIMEETDSDWMAAHRNIIKAWAVWRSLGKMLLWEGTDSWVSALFYRSVIHAVLMFRLESWALSDAIMRAVDGSHLGVLRQITRKRAWNNF